MAFWCEEVVLANSRLAAESWLALAVVLEIVFRPGMVYSKTRAPRARRVHCAERHLAKWQAAYQGNCRLKHHQSLHVAEQDGEPFLSCFPGERKNKMYKAAVSHLAGHCFESWSQAVASRILLDMLDKLPGIGRGTYLVDEQLADQRDEEFLAFQQCTPGLREVYYSLSAKIEGLHVCREDCLMNSVGDVMIAELFCKLVVNGGGCSHVVLGKPCTPIAGTRKLTSCRYDVVQVYVDWGLEDVVRACEYVQTEPNRLCAIRLNI